MPQYYNYGEPSHLTQEVFHPSQLFSYELHYVSTVIYENESTKVPTAPVETFMPREMKINYGI